MAEDQRGRHALEGRRVLIVEDEAPIALDLQGILLKAGCVVVGPAARLDRALLSAAEEAVDVALLDVNLHGEHVFAVADALAARGIPFLFLTGYGATILPERFQHRPLYQKPFSPRDLCRMLENALAQAGAEEPDAAMKGPAP